MVKPRPRRRRLQDCLKADGTRLFSDEAIASYDAARARLRAYIEKDAPPKSPRRP